MGINISVSLSGRLIRFQLTISSRFLGFIPVAYASLVSLLQPPIQLPTDSEDDMAEPLKPSGKRLHGWRILLLCLPTCCDLAGTTVSPSCTSVHQTV